MEKVKVKSATVYVDFEEFEGDTLEMLFNYKNPDGTQVNLTGYTAKMDIRTAIGAAALITVTQADALVLGGVTNNISIALTPAQTKTTLGVGSFVYDIQLTDTLSKVNTLIAGKIVIKASVTQ